MARKVVKGRVTPAFVSPGFAPIEFMKALDLSAHANPYQTTFFSASDARITNARTAVARAFMEESDAEWIWYLDTDSIFQSDALPRLLKTAHLKKAKVVAGMVFILDKTNGRIFPNCFWEVKDRGPGQKKYKFPVKWPDEPFEIDGTGGACLLVHREVMEAIYERYKDHPYPWQDERIDEWSGAMQGEDLVFCEKIKECGYSIWYDPGVEVGHLKEVIIGQRDYQAFLRKNQHNLRVTT